MAAWRTDAEAHRAFEAAIEWLSRRDRNRFARELYREVLPLVEHAEGNPALVGEAATRTKDFVRRLVDAASGGPGRSSRRHRRSRPDPMLS